MCKTERKKHTRKVCCITQSSFFSKFSSSSSLLSEVWPKDMQK